LADEFLQCGWIVDNRKVIECPTDDSSQVGSDFNANFGLCSELLNPRRILTNYPDFHTTREL